MRPIYETSADRARENGVRVHLMERFGCAYQKAPPLYCIDGQLLNGEGRTVGLVEIKTRKNTHNKYPTYMLSASKWRKAMTLGDTMKVPVMLVVQFTDGIYMTRLKSDYPKAQGGRTDRNDAMDIEECIYIPITEFKPV